MVVPPPQSCGSSRTVLQRYSEQCKEGAAARSGLRFLKHNIRNEFDDPSDVARMFRVRAAPCVYFFVGGANVSASTVACPLPIIRTAWVLAGEATKEKGGE